MISMMTRVRRVIFSILEKVQLLGVHSSCKAEFMAGTEAARQALWLQELLSEITGYPCDKLTIRIDNRSAISLTKNHVFHGRSKHMHSRYHFIRECVESELIEVDHVPRTEQKADILTKKALGRIMFKEMRGLQLFTYI